MTLYRLCEWEENGYHDSYGQLAYFDSEKNELGQIEHWATAYGGGPDLTPYLYPCGTVIEQARKVLEKTIYSALKENDMQMVYNPRDKELSVGTKVRTNKPVKNKERTVSDCSKCNGSGHWINPRNPDDKRPCFNCHGTGKVQGEPTGQWVKIPKGTVGEIIDTYQYKRNSPVSFTIRAEDGSIFRCGSKSLRLDRKPESDGHWAARAFKLSFHFNWKSAVSTFGGWLSTDWTFKGIPSAYWAVCPHCGEKGTIAQDKNGYYLECCGKRVDKAEWCQYCVEQRDNEDLR